jgi:hypothetical protein
LVYPGTIEPAKPTDMKEIDFPDWPERLAQAALPDRQKQSFAITLRWYLSFCRRSRGGVNVQSARDFIAWAQQTKRPEPWKLENWREAIRWFFREAQATGAAREHAVSAPHPEARPDAGHAPWKTAFLTTLRRRHYSFEFRVGGGASHFAPPRLRPARE